MAGGRGKPAKGGRCKVHPPALEDGSIDAGLHLLLLLTPPGACWTQSEIAWVCGCSRGLIYLIEKSARQKIKREFERRGFGVNFR